MHRPILRGHSGDAIAFLSLESLGMLSARNQLPGLVKAVNLGNVMAEVIVQVGDREIVAAITRGSVESLELRAGDSVTVVIKSTDVMVDKA